MASLRYSERRPGVLRIVSKCPYGQMKLWHEGFWLLVFNIKRPFFSENIVNSFVIYLYIFCVSVFAEKNCLLPFFLMGVNANFADELLGKF